jgi:hypothetical protein
MESIMQATLVQPSNAPNFCFEVLDEAGKSLQFVQTDWEYPSLAQSFGWSLTDVQHCRKCKKPIVVWAEDDEPARCDNCNRKKGNVFCDHETDGTVNCKKCGITASDFISAAYDFLAENEGIQAEWSE